MALEHADAIERQLAVYARVALAPDPRAMGRIRDAIRREALAAGGRGSEWRATELRVLDGGEKRAARARLRRAGRRAGTLLAAAALTLAVGGTVLASTRAGAPLYDVRVWLEQVMLPGDPDARLQAEIARAQTRLAEAAEADAAGNDAGVQAALDAYARIVEQTLAGGAAAAVGAERATLAFRHQQSVLESLAAEFAEEDSPAADALEHALAQSSKAVDRLGGSNAADPSGVPGDPPTARPSPGQPDDRPGTRPGNDGADGTGARGSDPAKGSSGNEQGVEKTGGSGRAPSAPPGRGGGASRSSNPGD